MERRLSVTNLSLENKFADGSTEFSIHLTFALMTSGFKCRQVIFQAQVGNR